MLGIVFSTGIITIFIINYKLKNLQNFVYGRNVKSPTMNMLIAVFGLQQTILPTRNFARFILMVFLLFCLINRNVYQGALYIFLQSDGRHKPFQYISDLNEMGFKYYMYSTYADLMRNGSSIYKGRIIINSEEELPYAKEVGESLKAAFMTPLTDVMYRNKMARGKFALRVCRHKMSVLSTVMYMNKGYFLKDTIDDLLLRYDSFGLLSYWFNKYAESRYLRIETNIKGPKKLTVEHLFGVFNIMLIGHGMSIVIFILEILIFRIKKLRAVKSKVNRRIVQLKKIKKFLKK